MKHLAETVSDGLSSVVSWAIITLLGGGVWVVRRVFTNQKQIELLQAHLEARDEMRDRDRDDLQEVKRDVKDLSRHVLDLFKGVDK